MPYSFHLNESTDRHTKWKFAFVSFVAIFGCRLWSFHGIQDHIYGITDTLISAALIAIVLFHCLRHGLTSGQFSWNVLFFILTPLMGVIGAGIFHNQPIQLSLLVIKTIFFWLLYFVLHIFKIPVSWIISLMLVVGLVWAFLTVAQQFTYPRFLFYTRDGSDGNLLRAGIYRYMIEPKYYCLFVILFAYNRFQNKAVLIDICFVAIGLIGYFYFGTRQYAISAIICLLIATLNIKGRKRTIYLITISSVFFILFLLKDVLFQSYVEMTNDQLQDNDDVRLLAASFYLFDYWPHWMAMLTGNGRFHLDSTYGDNVEYLMTHLGYFREDVGIIGTFNYFGIFYVLNVISLNFKGLQNKFYMKGTSYLRLIFLNSVILIFLSDDYTSASAIPFFCFVFYLVDKAYQTKQHAQYSQHQYEENSYFNTHS